MGGSVLDGLWEGLYWMGCSVVLYWICCWDGLY